LVKTDDLEPVWSEAERRVQKIQSKLHRWAKDDPHRRFDDLYNLVADPAFLQVAWDRVRSNKGARTAGVDGETARYIETVRGLEGFLEELRSTLKDRTFRPLPARQRAIPKASGKVRYLGIAIPRRRSLPFALGIHRSRTGNGRKLRSFSCDRSSSRTTSTPRTAST
jgi:RNA-directed DNA polymerase